MKLFFNFAIRNMVLVHNAYYTNGYYIICDIYLYTKNYILRDIIWI